MTRFLLHNSILPAKEETGYIRVWGQHRLNYLKHLRKVLYYNLFTSGKLHSHLAEKNVTEELKATNMMLWVQKVNNIRERVIEVVNNKLSYK